jgi:cell division protein ZapA (FtsZ GTPase activity inhibitor)
MPILNLFIGKSKYSVDCSSEEEAKVIELAKKLNERVNNLSLAIRNVDEKTILMLCALIIEGELEDLKNDKGIVDKKEPEEVFNSHVSEEDLEKAIKEQVAMQIENTADYIQSLVKKINNL